MINKEFDKSILCLTVVIIQDYYAKLSRSNLHVVLSSLIIARFTITLFRT